MGMFSAAGKMIGGIISGERQKRGQERAIEAARFTPFNIRTGLGSVSSDGNSMSGSLSPEYQNIRDLLLNKSNSFLGSLAPLNFDPMANTASALGLMRQLAAPEEGRQQYDLESRLLSQGRLGLGDGTGGNPEMRSFFESRNQADLARQLQAFQLSQSLFNTQLQGQQANASLGTGLLGGAYNLDSGIDKLIQLGLVGGKYEADAGKNVADIEERKGKTEGDMWAGLFKGIGEGLDAAFGGGGGFGGG